MTTYTLLAILLAWSAAGLLAALAFGKAIQEAAPDDEDGLASSADSVKYIGKPKNRS